MSNAPVIWKPVIGCGIYDGIYEASILGEIRRCDGNPWSKVGPLKFHVGKNGYPNIVLCFKGVAKTFSVHRVICYAFHGVPSEKSLEVCHKDGNRRNNREDNLEWGTRKYNCSHKHKHGTLIYGDKMFNSVLKESDIPEIFRLRHIGLTPTEIAHRYSINPTHAHAILSRDAWSKIPVPVEYMVFPAIGRYPSRKLCTERIKEIFKLKCCGFTHLRISEMMGVSNQAIDKIFDGTGWTRTVEEIKTGTF